MSNQAPIIKRIFITGNQYTDTSALMSRIPLRVGASFDTNPSNSGRIIKHLMQEIKSLSYVAVEQKNLDNNFVDITFIISEKPLVQDFIFKGNKQFTSKDLKSKLELEKIQEIERPEAEILATKIKKRYEEKGYLNAKITLLFDVDQNNKATITFVIDEGIPVRIKRICFEGNEHIQSKTLRNILFSRELWIGSVLDGSGVYQKERLEADRHMIEQYYQDNGYLQARVLETKSDIDVQSDYLTVTFVIKEGSLFTIETVDVPDHEKLPAALVRMHIPIHPGQYYSRQAIIRSMKAIEGLWGSIGHIFAHVDPVVIPNFEQKTVHISFDSQPGEPFYLRKINIKGNNKTHDHIIRRSIPLEEGCLITTQGMEFTKNRIESLGYFDQRDGVNWKTVRMDKDTDGKQYADLDLLLKEAKTGNLSLQLNFGGSPKSISDPTGGLSAECNLSDRNLLGTGIKINLTGKLSKEEQNVVFNIAQPWLFDKPIYGAIDAYHRRTGYDELNFTRPVNEIHTGGAATIGFMTGLNWHQELFNDIFVRANFGGERIRYEEHPTAFINVTPLLLREEAQTAYNIILNRLFSPGSFGLIGINIGQEKRNHPMHTSRGYNWLLRSQTDIGIWGSNFGFERLDFDAHWYTPLIGERDLILHLRGFLGFAHPFENRSIPYRELFHIGGPASVRGFLFGQISPQFTVEGRSDSIGGKKALVVSAELVFPITPDFSIKGVCFYDGGAGWDSPFTSITTSTFITHNTFDYRHSVGFGVRLLNPMPITIDWGFKLDPRPGESTSEVHFNMSYGW